MTKKAVAGHAPASARGLPDDDNLPEQETSSRPPEYAPVVLKVRATLESGLALVLDQTECFGWMWKDESGICPVAKECDLASACARTYEEVQLRVAAAKELEQHDPAALEQAKMAETKAAVKANEDLEADAQSAAKPKDKGRKLDKKVKVAVVRGKWKGTGKFARTGYVNQARPVDIALQRMLVVFEDPPVLPMNWNPTNFATKWAPLGKLLTSRTSSYHAFLVNGVCVLRYWTNSANHALIDVVPELLDRVKNLPVLNLQPVSPGSLKKHRPCTYRFMLSATDKLEVFDTLADEVMKHFKLRVGKKK